MGLGPEDLRVIREIRENSEGGRCAILGHCTFWYDKSASLDNFRKELNFESVETFDINGSPSYKLDLQEEIPEQFHNKYDLILDVGTAYSVFDVASLFKNLIHMLKVGGKIWHQTNLVGHFGRGYWGISPSVLYEYYTQNGFSVERMGFYIKGIEKWIDFNPQAHNLENATNDSFSFTPNQASFRGMVRNDTSLMCLVTKKKDVAEIKRPVPQHYIRTNGV
jgi:hypothetical protein